MASRLEQLQQLANQAPQLENKALARGKDARTALLQQQLGAIPEANLQQAQQLQAQQATIAGQQQAEVMKQGQQAAAQIGGQALDQIQANQANVLQQASIGAEQRQASAKEQMLNKAMEESIASRKRVTQSDIDSAKLLQQRGFDVDNRLQFASERQRQDLAKMGNNIKQELLDSRLAFEKDEAGRKFSNDRQLADYIASNAKTQQEFDSKMSGIANVARQQAVMTAAFNERLNTILNQGYIESKGDLDNAQRIRLAALRSETTKAAEKAKANAANKILMGQAIGTIVGVAGVGAAAAAGVIAAPVVVPALMAGAALGGATGTIAATNT
jgi:hypothetical protein